MSPETFLIRQYLKEYYSTIFPSKSIQLWLSYGNGNENFLIKNTNAINEEVDNFEFREFSFTTLDNQFSRYSAFKDDKDMRKKLVALIPAKLDVGPFFNKKPILDNKDDLIPLSKELIIDIDLNDYDDIRICCSRAKLCQKCWKYMVVACKIIDSSLREDWGFKHILWIYSGRRGIHCWICDPDVQSYSTVKRSAISGFFQLVTKSSCGQPYAKIKVMNRFIRRSLDIIDEVFISMCIKEQDMLGNEHRIKKFIELSPSPGTKQEIEQLFQSYSTSLDRWKAFVEYFKGKIANESRVWLKNRYFVEEIKILYCYPRLDRNVTTALNHLLKVPFSMHPKTKKISVPFDPRKIAEFSPLIVPTVLRIVDEKNSYLEKNSKSIDENKIQYWRMTSLREPMMIFNNFLKDLYKERQVLK